ncbi:MAG: exodeoxyribonuclease VII small subunit [Terrimicrobiaceae bacterium]|nr:exodeoxyribonuclease VII small subunit [Terrimicrobiaceae bacterium]
MKAGNPPPTLEEALARIEELVAEMESGKLGLEDILARFEEGSRLARLCREKLEAAERRIEIIVKEAGIPAGVAEFGPGPE